MSRDDWKKHVRPIRRKAKPDDAANNTAMDEVLGDLDGAISIALDWIVKSAKSPQPFITLGAVMAAFGALAGRRYASRTDLRTNLFVVGLGGSGSGKDHPRKCIKRLFFEAGLSSYFGGEEFASAQAISEMLAIFPARVCMLDEFGHMIGGITGKGAAGHKAEILPTLTKLFTSASEPVFGKEYANQRGQDGKRRADLHEPHLCVFGTTVASRLWQAVGNGTLKDGSLARFMLFQTPNDVPDRNKAQRVAPPPDLVEWIKGITAGVPYHDYGGDLAASMSAACSMTPYVVPETPEAEAALDALEDEQVAWMRRAGSDSAQAFIARWWENAVTCAMIRAISRNPTEPLITDGDVAWARKLSRYCLGTMMRETDAHVSDSLNEANEKRLVHEMREALRKTEAAEISLTDLGSATRFLDRKSRGGLIADLVEREVLAWRDAPAIPPAKKGTRLYRIGPNAP